MQSEGQREKGIKKNDQSLGEIWDTANYTSKYIIGILKGQEKEKKEQKKIQRNNF